MKKMFKYLIGLGLAAIAGVAIAQTVSLPLATAVGKGDYVQVIKNGSPSAQSLYTATGGVAGIENYSYQIPLTGFTITVANGIDFLYLNPAGTLATGTLTMMANPGDGQRFCVSSTQTQTAITINANTNQTLSAIGLGATPITALVANTRYCWFYSTALSAWVRYV
jgi:hypothetical protein